MKLNVLYILSKSKLNKMGKCPIKFRITFATIVLLYNNAPMEIVSKLLGHSKMMVTQDTFGKVVQKKVSLEIERLRGSV